MGCPHAPAQQERVRQCQGYRKRPLARTARVDGAGARPRTATVAVKPKTVAMRRGTRLRAARCFSERV